jgi:hypothetical protein
MIEYELMLPDGRTLQFQFDPSRPQAASGTNLPHWTLLEHKQCPGCPLAGKVQRCPAAVGAKEIIEAFKDVASTGQLLVTVTTPQREMRCHVDAQTAVRSMLGLALASSGCPELTPLRPLAVHHLPFADVQETLFRTVGAWMVRQYFEQKQGREPDFALVKLHEYYDRLQIVNRAFFGRVEAAVNQDANANAVGQWFSMAALVSMSLEEGLEDLEGLFAPPKSVVDDFETSRVPQTTGNR